MSLSPLPFPLDVDKLLPEGVWSASDAEARGGLLGLVLHAWSQDPPCSLPSDEAVLARVARLSPEGWARVRPIVLGGSFARVIEPPAPGAGRLLLVAARGLRDEIAASLLEEAERRRQRTARATAVRLGLEGARSRPGTEERSAGPPGATSRSRGVLVTSTSRARHEPAVPPVLRSLNPSLSPLAQVPSAESSPLALSRSSGEGDGSIAGRLGDGARAMPADRMALWRLEKARGLLQAAHAAWTREGRLAGRTGRGGGGVPLSKFLEVANDPRATPARVEAAIEAAAGKANPFGYLLVVLCQSSSPGARLIEPDVFVAQKWSQREDSRRRELERADGLQSKLDSLRAGAGVGRGGPGAAGVVS